MYYIAVAIEVLHALAMVLWAVGLPLLFWHRFPKLTLIYACYALIFILINQVSQFVLGECVLTTMARWFWNHSGQHESTEQWFSIKLAKMVFGLTPNQYEVKAALKIMVGVCAIGGFYTVYKKLLLKKRISNVSAQSS